MGDQQACQEGGTVTEPLFSIDQVTPAAGAVERATAASLAAADLDKRDQGAGQALLALAWALDAARAAGKFYGVAQAAPPYLEQARALGLTVDARKEAQNDALSEWLNGVTAPPLGHPAQP